VTLKWNLDLGVVQKDFDDGLLFALQAALRKTRPGELFALVSDKSSVGENLDRWARLTGNSVVQVSHEGQGTRFVLRNGPAPVEEDAMPVGARLWLYTNFDCNLACDYCCVRSSPQTPRRQLGLATIRRIAEEAPPLGVREILLTGGEPMLLPDICEIIDVCADALPTTMLTNGLLLQGRRLDELAALGPSRVTLQVSLDSPTPELHDRHRGAGSWQKALRGIRAARALGFRVRFAATVESAEQADAFAELLDRENVAEEDRVIRPIAQRGEASDGIALSRADLAPEITITEAGVFWHPVGGDDQDLFITAELFPLAQTFETVREAVAREQQLGDRLLAIFHCA
jgi:organic radical activating enzyme/TusA-related sulfurtransferase